MTLNGTDIPTQATKFDGFTSKNFKGGYLTDGNVTITFLCPDLAGGGSGTGASPSPLASPAGSPATEPSTSPGASSSP